MPKIINRDQYRKELLSKCFDLFAHKGYAAITMRQIAEGLGVSTGTLYHYFPSKQVLFEQLVEEISQQDVTTAAAQLEGMQTLQERVEALGRFLVKNEEYFIKQAFIIVDYCQHQDREELRKAQFFQQIDERYQQAIANFLEISDPAIAWFILSLINGLILERLWGNEKISFTEQIALLGKMLMLYLE
ncbi:TetR/AcrR family transcriptional regulator [Funiculus sociatus GB2-A5]|uniref:TetR/AcrR family transcriptional regulator n=1 Tax=Funiculus sociatus GB2-A5 TaxID=2933946 RepID=A0ABV0JRK7_9CYAN|nr:MULTISPECIES: TetR/AcrR family transcriptional regulator [unclassified Trichocoleus]MBD1906006.1 TetR/AcrR family transcriptional regulator [Trichocoleus sp. FACHB-832]MBD2061951.1 TetR/AcrR family transcriptional regulator [Trichocoleus sp. FACHB-6]